MAKITTPTPGFRGRIIGVDFVDGEGSTDDETAIRYFSEAGYLVDGDAAEPDPENDLGLDRPAPVIGVEYVDPDLGTARDAADPRNDLTPVGGVKSDGTIVAGPGKGKRVAPSPSQPVQETGDPNVQSASPSGTNPVEAVSPAGSSTSDATTGDSGSATTGSSAPVDSTSADTTGDQAAASTSGTSSKKG